MCWERERRRYEGLSKSRSLRLLLRPLRVEYGFNPVVPYYEVAFSNSGANRVLNLLISEGGSGR